MKDFIPQNRSAFADWLANFYGARTTLGAIYGLARDVTQLEKDNDWVQFWIQAKFTARQQESWPGDFVGGARQGRTTPPRTRTVRSPRPLPVKK